VSLHNSVRIAFAAIVVFPAFAGAQIVRNTGVDVTGGNDNRWTISQNGGATYTAAAVVASPPGVWATFAGQWVSGNASGTGGSGDYRLRTQFSLGVGDVLSFTMRCAVDNSSQSIWLNNAQVGGVGSCGSQNSFQFGSAINFSSFLTGLNTFEIRWTGDATTDGGAVEFSNVSYVPGGNMNVVPEPSTYALMATGFGLLGLVGRRKRLQR
jgi:hypothetical protein